MGTGANAGLGTVERHGGRSVLRFERRLAHPVERVWAALTEPAQLREWLGDAEVELVEGGRFTVRWLNTGPGGGHVVMHATVTALDPPRLLEVAGDPHGVLRWELRPDRGSTLLTFTDTLRAGGSPAMALAGWHLHLDLLAEALAGRPFDWPDWPRSGLPRWQRTYRRYGGAP